MNISFSNVQYYIFFVIFIIFAVSIIRNLGAIFGGKNSSKMELTRLEELQRQQKKKTDDEKDEEIRQILIKVTDPIADKVFKNKQPQNAGLIFKKLKLAGWDKYFSPLSWISFVWLLRIIGIVLFLGLFGSSKIFAVLVFVSVGVMPSFLLNNSYNNNKDRLMMSFPDMINIFRGYLSAKMTLVDAAERTADSCGSPEWARILRRFSQKYNHDGAINALNWMKNEVDIVEAREFFTTLRLTLENGGSEEQGFADQADRIEKMLADADQKKIEKRKVWATVVQAPIFLIIMAAFGLPVIGTFADLF